MSFPHTESVHNAILALEAHVGGPMLSVDTSTSHASVCMVGWPEREKISYLSFAKESLPSESLAAELGEALKQSGLKAAHLKAIAVGLGPGSFTGLRVGLSVLKGVALASQVPLYGYSSLALWAMSAEKPTVCTAVDARQNEIYCGAFEFGGNALTQVLVDDGLQTPAAFQKAAPKTSAVYVGDAKHYFAGQSVTWEDEILPQAGFGFLLAQKSIRAGEGADLRLLNPVYHRITQAERHANLKTQAAEPT